MRKALKLRSTLCAGILSCLVACSGDSASVSVSDVPEGKHWQVILDGGTPIDGSKLTNQHVSGRLILMLRGEPFGSGISIFIPMEKQFQTGVFEEGLEFVMRGQGMSDYGTCEHKPDSNTSKANVSINITESSKELFIATFTFSDVECEQDGTVVSGNGVITEKRAAKK
jgi:hypothetical protein